MALHLPFAPVEVNQTFIKYFPSSEDDLIVQVTPGWEIQTSPRYDWHGLKRLDTGFAILQITLSGRGMIECAGTPYPLTPGKIFLVEVPDDHRYYLPAAWAPWEFAYFYFTMTGDVARIIRYIRQQYGTVYALHAGSAFFDDFSGLMTTIYRNALEDAEAVTSAFYHLLTSLRQALRQNATKHISPIRRAEQFIATQFGTPITVNDIAQAVGYTPAYFSTRFHEEIGLPPHEYLMDIRLRHARHLLVSTHRTLEEIARYSGFDNGNYFGKVFRKKYGITPHQYRTQGDRGM